MPKKRAVEKRPFRKPKKEINMELLKRMAARHCTMQEMADCLGCHVDTLYANYSDVIKEAKAQGKLGLRDQQWKILEKGSADMAKWLGRCILGQNENANGITDQQIDNLTKLTETLDRAREEDSQSQTESS